MGQSIRYVKRGVQGVIRENFNWPIIEARSVVHISAGEVSFGTTYARHVTPSQDFYYHLGDAGVWVSNISPHRNEFADQPGGVWFVLHVDYSSPIDVGITITVEDALPIEIQGY